MLGLTSTDSARDLPDEDVLARSQAQPWLFGVLVDRYQDAFLRKAKSVVRDPLDAEEVVQDAFTKIYVNAHKFQPQEGARFSSWAYKILMNTAFTRYQKKVKENQRKTNIDPEYEHLVADTTEGRVIHERQDALGRVLERLPEHFTYVLRLHYIERWSHKDIAGETGETVGTVKARIHRAKAAFRKEAKDGEVESLLH